MRFSGNETQTDTTMSTTQQNLKHATRRVDRLGSSQMLRVVDGRRGEHPMPLALEDGCHLPAKVSVSKAVFPLDGTRTGANRHASASTSVSLPFSRRI